MADISNIEWTDATFNPWEGCQKVGPGCDNCYAENRNARFGGGVAVNWGPGAPRRRTSAVNWHKPVQWNREHAAFEAEHGRRRRVFCASLADVFDNAVDQQWRDDLFELIRATPHLDWLLLTKRIGNVGNMLPVPFDFGRLYPNVWLGATVVNQAEADRDIPKLLALEARVRFLSIEPMLGPIDLRDVIIREVNGTRIDWVIAGGESGPHARPSHPDWYRSLRDQCAAAGVPFLFKQWGEWRPMRIDEVPNRGGMSAHLVSDGSRPPIGDGCFHMAHQLESMVTDPAYGWQVPVIKLGKKAAGRLLDGVTHDGAPS